MRNTEYNENALQGIISASSSLESLMGLIDDFGLELTSVTRA